MQSHKTFPLGVQTTSARWPIANCGCVPMPITPGPYWRYELKCPAVRAASVVQVCPRGGTYCRSSSQITHCRGATLLGVYWVPQAVQMNASISLFREHALFMHVDYRPSPAGFARIYQTENEKWGRLAKRVQPEGKRLMNTKSKITIAVLAGVCGQDHLTDESSFLEFELERNK